MEVKLRSKMGPIDLRLPTGMHTFYTYINEENSQLNVY
jgi:hypothetical protein